MPSITTPAPAGQTVRRLTTHGRTRRKKNGFLRIVRRITTALPRKKRIVPCITIPAVRCTVDFFRNVPSITTAAKILQFGNCAPDNNPTAGNVRWITTRSGHVWKADEIPKCAADNNSRILPTAQIVLWITTCRPQKKVRIVRPITTINSPSKISHIKPILLFAIPKSTIPCVRNGIISWRTQPRSKPRNIWKKYLRYSKIYPKRK